MKDRVREVPKHLSPFSLVRAPLSTLSGATGSKALLPLSLRLSLKEQVMLQNQTKSPAQQALSLKAIMPGLKIKGLQVKQNLIMCI